MYREEWGKERRRRRVMEGYRREKTEEGKGEEGKSVGGESVLGLRSSKISLKALALHPR